MPETIYLYLLFFCAILWQEVLATFSDEDNKLSSDFLVRKRRVINNILVARNTTPIEAVNYMIRIRENNRGTCAGAILSHYNVITAASCIRKPLSSYTIFSGSARDARSNSHRITSTVTYFGNLPRQLIDGIALLTIDPPFVYSPKTGNIHLNLAPLPADALVWVSGWGCFYPPRPASYSRAKLVSINLPIMNHEECRNIYRNNSDRLNVHNAISITEKHICTYHAQQYCARGDVGAPLVYNNLLIGVHVLKGELPNQRNPDIFINLQLPEYRDWINEHSLSM